MFARLSRRRRRIVRAGLLGSGFVLLSAAIVRVSTSRDAGYLPGGPVEGLTATLDRTLAGDPPEVVFADVTEAAGIRFRQFGGVRTSQLPEDMGSGAAWGDFDRDGWPDLFVVAIAEPLPTGDPASGGDAGEAATRSVLYRNLGDGTFEDVTDASRIDHRRTGMGAAWADYDNDGFLDLVVTSYGHTALYHNEGDGTFRDVSDRAGMDRLAGFWTGAAWGDYDRDGRLDLYVTGYVRYSPGAFSGAGARQYDVEVPATLNPSSFRPERNLLFRNRGDGTFREVGETAGVANREGRSLGAVWADFDGDGWLDLYVANDVSDNVMYRNLGDGSFEDVSHRALIADYRGAMGLGVGDWDDDGDPDLFITHWVAQENALFSNRRDTSAEGETRLRFLDEADRVGLGQIALEFIGWGTGFVDYDNDGRLDLFVTNGSTFQKPDDPARLVPMRDQLFWNRGAGEGFFDVSARSGPYMSEAHVGRGAAFADYDVDGDVDVLVVNQGDRPVLLRNDGGNSAGWVRLALEGRSSPRTPVGAAVRVRTGDRVQHRWLGIQTSYLSAHEPVVQIGLGAAAGIDSLEVVWPSGRRQVWVDLPARGTLTLTEGEASASGRRAPDRPDGGAPRADAAGPADTLDERTRTLRFWERLRSATQARVQGDLDAAERAYGLALELDPDHEDALYYLASVQADLGRVQAAAATLDRLLVVNPRSGRAFSRLGALRTCPSGEGSAPDLDAARVAFRRAWEINREQVGPPLWLGLIELLEGDAASAGGPLEAVLGSDPENVAGNALRAYAAWLSGDAAGAERHFERARPGARAEAGTVGLQEGDTDRRRAIFAGATSCPWLEDALGRLLADQAATDGGPASAANRLAEFHDRMRLGRGRSPL